jgi:energy-coupling factor transporter ATP-binding protein EcfA2
MNTGNASFSGNPTKQEYYHAFLSHNGADKSSVERLAEELEKRGLACWLDKWNLVPGDPWQTAIEGALGQCDTCVVFFGPLGLGPWHNEEMRLALQRRVNSRDRKLRVLPVILPGGQRAKESDVPGFLQGTTWVEFRQSLDEEDALYRLVCGIKGIPPGRRPGATILQGECPYLGLKTFQPEDAALFFGRTAKIQELIDRLRNNFGTPKEERFVALIGASGSGKSSLALAGLSPSIQRGELPASAKWPLVRCRPGTRPWESLQIALSTNQQIALHLAALPALIVRPEDEQRRLHLTAQLALHDQPENHRLFILIDQFEEIFTLCNDEGARRQLIDNVLYATNVAGGRTIVVLTMRADFYGQCASYPGLRAAIADHQSLIGPLSEEELREAIESPAQLAGGELEPGLMELLLADMKGHPGALPFLEHALFKLWEMRDGRRLTAKAYTEMGRLGGALDAHAEEFFTKTLSVEEQSLCRQLLVDLVHPGEGAADTKKRVSLDDVAPTDAVRAVLKKLADARLVTTDRDDRPEAAQAELAHEALISGWRRLGEWVNENREKSRLKERLLDSGREWQRSSKKEDFLYRGAQLATAQEIFGSSEELPKTGREFLEASIAARKRAQEEKQREQRGRRRLLTAASVVFALFLATSVFMWFGAQEQERIAESQRFHNESSSALYRFPRSLLLAVEALNVGASIEGARVTAVEQALREVLASAGGHPLVISPSLTKTLGINPHSHYLVIANWAGAVRRWDVPGMDPAANPVVLHGEGSAVNAVRISVNNRSLAAGRGDGTVGIWDAVDANRVYVLDDDFNLWLESRPAATIPPTRQQVDGRVASFEAVDENKVYVLDTIGNLWLEHGPFKSVPPTRQQVDGNVATFEQIDANNVYVLGTNGNLWLEHGPINSVPPTPTRQQVDGEVATFEAVDANNVYVLVINGELWLEHGPYFSRDRFSATQIDANAAAFGVIDANTIIVLERDGALWLESGPFGKIPPSRVGLKLYKG